MAGIGPGPFCGMLLSDLGADVVRVDRIGKADEPWNIAGRGRRSIAVDLKSAEGADIVLRLIDGADALIESYRPGVMERLGLGPATCLARNPRLVYGRLTGWGQTGPLAHAAGHDINYMAIGGALHGMGDPDRPPRPPQNFVADFGGGALLLALSLVSGILHARESGAGQVVDAAMNDGTALLTAVCHGRMTTGAWRDERGANFIDGSAPYYSTYECSDGRFLAVGAIEPQFTDELLAGLGLDGDEELRATWYDRDQWAANKARVAAVVRARSRAEWVEIFADRDACVAPVLSLGEASEHPHHVARGTFFELDGITQPAPSPRLSRTPPEVRHSNPRTGEHAVAILAELGFPADQIAGLAHKGVVGP